MGHIGQIMPLFAETLCKEYEYLVKNELWDGTIPRYIKDYSRTRKKQ